MFSDVHDNLENAKKMLDIFTKKGIDTLIFCGDFCSPIPARVLGGGFAGDIHCVFGNGDGDRFTISKFANTEFQNLKLYGEYAELEFEGVKTAVTHYPFYADALAKTGNYKAVFCGHTHILKQENVGDCLVVNPGEVMGWKGDATCVVYNTIDNTIEIIHL